MHATLFHMLSTNSLQAFSGAATTSPLNGPAPPNPVRLIRAQSENAARQATPAIPTIRPGLPPPRGSLLNLSV